MTALAFSASFPFYRKSMVWAKRAFFSLPFYRYTLWQKQMPTLSLKLPLYWHGDADQGAEILRSEYTLSGKPHYIENPWFETNLTEMAESDLHSFVWLSNLSALGGSAARSRARELIEEWIHVFPRWDVLIWKPDILGQRLTHWLAAYRFFGESADLEFQQLFFRSLTRQAQHLKRAIGTSKDTQEEIRALKGMISCCLALAKYRKHLSKYVNALIKTASAALIKDGGVKHRSPSIQLEIFQDLAEVRHFLIAAKVPTPDSLEDILTSMAPILKFFRHADGGLALFNCSFEESSKRIDEALLACKDKSKVPQQLLESGFIKAITAKSMLFMDVGVPSKYGSVTAAGTMSFELSFGKDRLFVNCGGYTGDQAEWLQASRTSAAHTALAVDDTSSSQIDAYGHVSQAPKNVKVIRQDQDGNVLIEANQDGYEAQFRLNHTRRIFMGKTGDDIRGEDLLTGEEGRIYTVRFHLHPRIKASITQDKKKVMLILPSGSAWSFKSNGANMNLEDSIYLGQKGHMNKTLQIVVSGAISPKKTTLIKWALQKQN